MATTINTASGLTATGRFTAKTAGDYEVNTATTPVIGTFTDGADKLTLTSTADSPVTAYMGSGNDTLDSSAAAAGAAVKAFGGAGNDILTGGAADDTLFGDAGHDNIVGGAGTNKLYGGDGNDTLDNSAGTGIGFVDGGAGNDSLLGAAAVADTLLGGAGNDTILGGAVANQYIDGGDDDDTITVGAGGSNSVYGGAGNDTITGSVAKDTLNGGAGNDVFLNVGDTASDTVIGGAGNDLIKFAATHAGDTTIVFGGGVDTIDGFTFGATSDQVSFDVTADKLAFSLDANGNLEITDGVEGDKVVFANATGTYDKTNIAVKKADGTADNYVATFGTSAADAALVVAQDGSGYGFAGDDSFSYTLANHTAATSVKKIDGGAGTDTLTLASAAYGSVNLYDARFVSVENIDNSANATATYLRGDKIGTNNKLTAGTGGDQLWGGSSINVADTVTGVTDADTLVGGAGADTFWFGKGDGTDTIQHQTAGSYAGDIVKLYNVSRNELTFTRSGADLVVSMNDSSEVLTIKDWEAGTTKPTFQDIDGTFTVTLSTPTTNGSTIAYDANAISINGTEGIDTLTVANGATNANDSINLFASKFTSVENIDNHLNTVKTFLRGDKAGTNNKLIAGTAADELWGGVGADADTLVGGAGANVFWVGKNDGNDLITNYDNTDTVKLYNIASASELTWAVNDNDLKATITATGETITLQDWDNVGAGRPSFMLSDGSTFKASVWTSAADTIAAPGTPSVIVTGAGNDTINAALGDIVLLDAGEGTDTLNVATAVAGKSVNLTDSKIVGVENLTHTDAFKAYLRGNAENNIITAGTAGDELWGGIGGNDTLIGAAGPDKFWFGKNDGQDVIDGSGNGDQVLLYTTGLTTADVTATIVNNADLQLAIGSDILTIKNFDQRTQYVFGRDVNPDNSNVYTVELNDDNTFKAFKVVG
jgi:Ca2+-binding RTX toxin-like protein